MINEAKVKINQEIDENPEISIETQEGEIHPAHDIDTGADQEPIEETTDEDENKPNS